MNYERVLTFPCVQKFKKYAQIRTADRIEGHFFYYETSQPNSKSKSKRKNVTQSKLPK